MLTHIFVSVKCDVPTYACQHVLASSSSSASSSATVSSSRNQSLSRPPSVAPSAAPPPRFASQLEHSQQQQQQQQQRTFPPPPPNGRPRTASFPPSSSASRYNTQNNSGAAGALPFTQQQSSWLTQPFCSQQPEQHHHSHYSAAAAGAFLAPEPRSRRASSTASMFLCSDDDPAGCGEGHNSSAASFAAPHSQRDAQQQRPLHVVLVASSSTSSFTSAADGAAAAGCGCTVDGVSFTAPLPPAGGGWSGGRCCITCLTQNLHNLARHPSVAKQQQQQHGGQDGICPCSSSLHQSQYPSQRFADDDGNNNYYVDPSSVCPFFAASTSTSSTGGKDAAFLSRVCGDARFWTRLLYSLTTALGSIHHQQGAGSNGLLCCAMGGEHWAVGGSAAERFVAAAAAVCALAPLQLHRLVDNQPSSSSSSAAPPWQHQLGLAFDQFFQLASLGSLAHQARRPARHNNIGAAAGAAWLPVCAALFVADSWISSSSASSACNSEFALLCASKIAVAARTPGFFSERSAANSRSRFPMLLARLASRCAERILLLQLFPLSAAHRAALQHSGTGGRAQERQSPNHRGGSCVIVDDEDEDATQDDDDDGDDFASSASAPHAHFAAVHDGAASAARNFVDSLVAPEKQHTLLTVALELVAASSASNAPLPHDAASWSLMCCLHVLLLSQQQQHQHRSAPSSAAPVTLASMATVAATQFAQSVSDDNNGNAAPLRSSFFPGVRFSPRPQQQQKEQHRLPSIKSDAAAEISAALVSAALDALLLCSHLLSQQPSRSNDVALSRTALPASFLTSCVDALPPMMLGVGSATGVHAFETPLLDAMVQVLFGGPASSRGGLVMLHLEQHISSSSSSSSSSAAVKEPREARLAIGRALLAIGFLLNTTSAIAAASSSGSVSADAPAVQFQPQRHGGANDSSTRRQQHLALTVQKLQLQPPFVDACDGGGDGLGGMLRAASLRAVGAALNALSRFVDLVTATASSAALIGSACLANQVQSVMRIVEELDADAESRLLSQQLFALLDKCLSSQRTHSSATTFLDVATLWASASTAQQQQQAMLPLPKIISRALAVCGSAELPGIVATVSRIANSSVGLLLQQQRPPRPPASATQSKGTSRNSASTAAAAAAAAQQSTTTTVAIALLDQVLHDALRALHRHVLHGNNDDRGGFAARSALLAVWDAVERVAGAAHKKSSDGGNDNNSSSSSKCKSSGKQLGAEQQQLQQQPNALLAPATTAILLDVYATSFERLPPANDSNSGSSGGGDRAAAPPPAPHLQAAADIDLHLRVANVFQQQPQPRGLFLRAVAVWHSVAAVHSLQHHHRQRVVTAFCSAFCAVVYGNDNDDGGGAALFPAFLFSAAPRAQSNNSKHAATAAVASSVTPLSALVGDLCVVINFAFDSQRLVAAEQFASQRSRGGDTRAAAASASASSSAAAHRGGNTRSSATTRTAAAVPAAVASTPLILFSAGAPERDQQQQSADLDGHASPDDAAMRFFSPAVCGANMTAHFTLSSTTDKVPRGKAQQQPQQQQSQHTLPWQTPCVDVAGNQPHERGGTASATRQNAEQHLSAWVHLRRCAVRLLSDVVLLLLRAHPAQLRAALFTAPQQQQHNGGTGGSSSICCGRGIVESLLHSNNDLLSFREDDGGSGQATAVAPFVACIALHGVELHFRERVAHATAAAVSLTAQDELDRCVELLDALAHPATRCSSSSSLSIGAHHACPFDDLTRSPAAAALITERESVLRWLLWFSLSTSSGCSGGAETALAEMRIAAAADRAASATGSTSSFSSAARAILDELLPPHPGTDAATECVSAAEQVQRLTHASMRAVAASAQTEGSDNDNDEAALPCLHGVETMMHCLAEFAAAGDSRAALALLVCAASASLLLSSTGNATAAQRHQIRRRLLRAHLLDASAVLAASSSDTAVAAVSVLVSLALRDDACDDGHIGSDVSSLLRTFQQLDSILRAVFNSATSPSVARLHDLVATALLFALEHRIALVAASSASSSSSSHNRHRHSRHEQVQRTQLEHLLRHFPERTLQLLRRHHNGASDAASSPSSVLRLSILQQLNAMLADAEVDHDDPHRHTLDGVMVGALCDCVLQLCAAPSAVADAVDDGDDGSLRFVERLFSLHPMRVLLMKLVVRCFEQRDAALGKATLFYCLLQRQEPSGEQYDTAKSTISLALLAHLRDTCFSAQEAELLEHFC